MTTVVEKNSTDVSELAPNMRSVNVTFKVIDKERVREVHSRKDDSTHYVTDATVGDETGIVKMTLWDDTIEEVERGKVYTLKEGYTDLFRGSLRLKIGRHSTLEESDREIDDVNKFVNKSRSDSRHSKRRHYYLGY